jgi:hypothetical protein
LNGRIAYAGERAGSFSRAESWIVSVRAKGV